jgi:hypothetical protein
VSSGRVGEVGIRSPCVRVKAASVWSTGNFAGGTAGSRGMTTKCWQVPASSNARLPMSAIGSSGVPSKQK